MITILDAPCWRLIDPAGKDYDADGSIPHFDTAVQAEQYLRDLEKHVDQALMLTAKQFNQPCYVPSCDKCGQAATDDDLNFDALHYPDLETAQTEVVGYEMVLIGERGLVCEECDPDAAT